MKKASAVLRIWTSFKSLCDSRWKRNLAAICFVLNLQPSSFLWTSLVVVVVAVCEWVPVPILLVFFSCIFLQIETKLRSSWRHPNESSLRCSFFIHFTPVLLLVFYSRSSVQAEEWLAKSVVPTEDCRLWQRVPMSVFSISAILNDTFCHSNGGWLKWNSFCSVLLNLINVRLQVLKRLCRLFRIDYSKYNSLIPESFRVLFELI